MTTQDHGALYRGFSSRTYWSIATMCFKLYVLILVSSYSFIDGQRVPFISPYFYLCNYDGLTDQSSIEVGEVALSVSVENDPEFYIPGQLYTGWFSSFCIRTLWCWPMKLTFLTNRVHLESNNLGLTKGIMLNEKRLDECFCLWLF